MIKQCIKHVTLPLKGTVCYRQICVGHVLTEWLSVLIIGKNGITGMIGSTLQKIHMSLGIITYHPQVDLKLFRIYYYCYIYTYIYTYIYNHIYIIYIYYKYIYIYTPSSSWSHHPQWNPRLCGWNQHKCASGVPKSHKAWGMIAMVIGEWSYEWLGGLLIPCCKYI